MAKSLGMDRPRGIIIQGVLENSAAEESGLKPGDVILEVDGREIDAPNQLQSYVAAQTAGTIVTLKIFRDGETLDKKVTLKARDDDSKADPIADKKGGVNDQKKNQTIATYDDIGLTVKNLNDREMKEYDVNHGVLINEVTSFSKAEDQRLFAGLVILEADKKEINDVNELTDIVDAKRGSALLLKVVDKQGNTRFVGLEIPE
jgi:S1-C subfamily serine protease